MAGGQERILRRRIRSVQSTKKITRAMELIAASRIVKAQARVVAAVPYADRITDVALYGPRQRRGGGVVRLQDDRPVPRRRRFACRVERVDRAGAVRVGPEMAMQIGRAPEVHAHKDRA